MSTIRGMPTVPCAHCGLPAPPARSIPEEHDPPAFCCPGCRSVYAILREAGLSDFYALRDELGVQPSAREPPGGERSTDAALAARYAHLDDPTFLATHGARPGSIELRVTGLHCAACVWVLERLPRALDGVLGARVDFGAERLHLRWDPDRISLSSIAAFVDQLGYPLHVVAGEADLEHRRRRRREIWRLVVTGALAGNVMLASFALYAGELGSMDVGFVSLFEWLGLVLSLPAVTWGALPFYRGAWAGLRMRMLHMDLPISLGIAAGFVASAWGTVSGSGHIYYDTVTILVFLLLVGRYLQGWGQRRLMTRTEMLHALIPGSARRRTDRAWQTVYVGHLGVGDRVRVDAGEVMPIDGVVRRGSSFADLGMLTGESRPLPVGVGSRVFAGTRVVGAPIEVEVEACGESTRIGKIVRRLSQHDALAPMVRLADRISGWFVAAVLTAAAAGGLAWWTVEPGRVFEVVVSLLVVSCPCALGLATPMALTVARARAARRGLLLRSTAALETLARVRTVVLDKTGTVTEGALQVVSARVEDPELVSWIAALERRSAHPIGRALMCWAGQESPGHGWPLATDVREYAGRGMEGVVLGRRIRVGSPSWIDPHGSSLRPATLEGLAEQILTPVLVEVDGSVVGVLGLGDRIRDEAPAVLQRLRAQAKKLVLASGDHVEVVASVARALDLSRAMGDLSPEGKAELVRRNRPVAMVGDGINDTLALEQADVGIAVRGGAEAALQVADVYLSRSDLGALAELFEGSARTLAVIRRNLTFSLIYNLVFASLALAGEVTPLSAAILMPLSSLTVIASSFVSHTFGRSEPSPQSLRPSIDSAQAFPVRNTVSRAIS